MTRVWGRLTLKIRGTLKLLREHLSEITAIASIVIASCAFTLTAIQGCTEIYDRRLSKLPELHVAYKTASASTGEKAGIFITSCGLGPARITLLKLRHGTAGFRNVNGLMTHMQTEWDESQGPGAPEIPWFATLVPFYEPLRRSLSPPGEVIRIVEFPDEFWSPEFNSFLLEYCSELELYVEYESVYAKAFSMSFVGPAFVRMPEAQTD